MDSDTKKAIEEYYKLKNEYETKIDKQRKKIRNDKTITKEEKTTYACNCTKMYKL